MPPPDWAEIVPPRVNTVTVLGMGWLDSVGVRVGGPCGALPNPAPSRNQGLPPLDPAIGLNGLVLKRRTGYFPPTRPNLHDGTQPAPPARPALEDEARSADKGARGEAPDGEQRHR
ncbi:hypothetical protein GCM10012286_32820 [Streptomyces lasiicapitis]|uniref:Uncharacterized protein n=1 Tax=Streptomyces lasiicapitis TaxID=1923961 RepID=A0ABQ2LYU2_9ACTN|nr:hypothetical protein GCM10012286_32820 [Streptomyces lasiicapitis]